MKIYIAIMYDRHVDDTYSVHTTLEGADEAVNDFIESYNGEYGEEWEEEDWGHPKWVRYVHGDIDDGPHALIEVSELHE